MALSLVNTSNVTDNATLAISLPTGITAAYPGGAPFLYVSGYIDSGISAFAVSAQGVLTNPTGSGFNVRDSDSSFYSLAGAAGLHTVSMGGATYLYAAALTDNAVSAFGLGGSGMMTSVHRITEDLASIVELDGATSVVSATIGGATYLFEAGNNDDGISSIPLNPANGQFVLNAGAAYHITDSATLELDGVEGLATAVVGGATYLFAAGRNDDGISIFTVAANGSLSHYVSLSDSGSQRLDGAMAIATAKVAGRDYFYVGSLDEGGISGYFFPPNGNPSNITNIADNATLPLAGISDLVTTTIAGTTYLFAAAQGDNGVSAFAIAADGTLVNVANVVDAGALQIAGARGLAIVVAGGKQHLAVTGFFDAGVSLFRIDATGNTISGTAANDTIDATHTPAGRLLPGQLGDTISGLGGNDTLSGLGGADIFDGGAGNDRQLGGLGNDIFKVLGTQGQADVFAGGSGTDALQAIGAAAVTFVRFSAGGSSIEKWIGNGRELLGTNAANIIDLSAIVSRTALPFVDGKSGNDKITGTKFADDLRGNAGNDTLIGGLGADKLDGGLGKDFLTGGADADRFIFSTRTHSAVGANADRIMDFDDGNQGDRIDVSLLFGSAMTYRHDGAFTAAGQVRINDVAGADVIVEVNISGTLAPDFSIRLVGTTLASMNADDFVL